MIEDAEGNNHCTACGMCERACPNGSINVLATKNIAGKKVPAATFTARFLHPVRILRGNLPVRSDPMSQDFELSRTDKAGFEMILKKEGQG